MVISPKEAPCSPQRGGARSSVRILDPSEIFPPPHRAAPAVHWHVGGLQAGLRGCSVSLSATSSHSQWVIWAIGESGTCPVLARLGRKQGRGWSGGPACGQHSTGGGARQGAGVSGLWDSGHEGCWGGLPGGRGYQLSYCQVQPWGKPSLEVGREDCGGSGGAGSWCVARGDVRCR